MKIAPTLEKIVDGAIGAPVIIQTKKDMLTELFPIISQLNLSFRKMPFFNMASTFLTSKIIDQIADLDIVEGIYVDWAIRLPEIPLGFTPADFITHPGFFGMQLLQSNFRARYELQRDWISTTDTRKFLGLEQARADGIMGQGVMVGVADSDGSARAANHRQFMGKAVERHTMRKAFQTDTNGHGTHVATTIAGKLYSPFPNFYVEGMAPDAQIILIKCLLTPLGAGSTSDCIGAVNFAFDRGVNVVNLSLGSECKQPEEDPFVKAVEQLPKDKILCAASGNEGEAQVGSPAVSENVLAVGALDVRTGEKADFSNTGPELDFIMPGVDIFSGIARETLLDVTGGGPEGFSALSGTSMATPHMTGMIALAIDLMSRYNFTPTIDTFREIGAAYGEGRTFDRGYGPLTYDMLKRYAEEKLT